jgi:transcriptional regulator GlxA family with amidase domain
MAADDFNSARDTRDRLRIVQSWAREWLRRAPESDPWADTIVHQLHRRIATPVSELAAATGLSERQLERRCLAAFGYGPATLRRILRLQRVLGLARHSSAPRSLARLAAHAGYADQQHLARDCRHIARTTPNALLGQNRPPDVGFVHDLTA